MKETTIIIIIDRETFCSIKHAETRLVITPSTERRDLLDRAGKVIAFSQRAAMRIGDRSAPRLAVVGARENITSYYATRREAVIEVRP